MDMHGIEDLASRVRLTEENEEGKKVYDAFHAAYDREDNTTKFVKAFRIPQREGRWLIVFSSQGRRHLQHFVVLCDVGPDLRFGKVRLMEEPAFRGLSFKNPNSVSAFLEPFRAVSLWRSGTTRNEVLGRLAARSKKKKVSHVSHPGSRSKDNRTWEGRPNVAQIWI